MLTNKLNVFFPLTFIKHFISKLKVELNLKVRYFGGNHFALGRRQGNLGQSTHYLLTLPTTYCTGQRHLSGLGNEKEYPYCFGFDTYYETKYIGEQNQDMATMDKSVCG